ncbi:hypothetical protein MIR68_010308 [Amoeboaphelidium protococcarum]|nr:hypothetical protein MIR68_010308 [Amoeboaphelidium protococcarum]
MMNNHLQKRLKLKNLQLLKSDAFIAGQWVSSGTKDNGDSRYVVRDPLTGDELAKVSNCTGHEDTKLAIDAAYDTFRSQQYKSLSPVHRSRLLLKWHDLIVDNKDDLANIVVSENGKPFKEAVGEVLYAASFVKWFAEEVKRDYGRLIPSNDLRLRLEVRHEPIGVCALITPWNFPLAMVTRKIAPAIAAGNTVVLKPSPETPLSALALAHLADQAGFLKGSINVVPCDKDNVADVGDMLCGDDRVRKLSFTGSTGVGVHLMAQCARTVKRTSMELGGNAPFIVLAPSSSMNYSESQIDQYLDSSVKNLVDAKLRNAGQTCIAPNRIIVHQQIHDQFVRKLTHYLRDYTVCGSGFDSRVNVGPLITSQAKQKVLRHLDDAQQKGSEVLYNGADNQSLHNIESQNLVAPILITGCTKDMAVASEETFGPLFSVFQCQSGEDAIQMSDDTQFGLAAYLMHPDRHMAQLLAQQLESGMMGINTGTISYPQCPFGGVKHSGVGREGGVEGLLEFLNVKYMAINDN